jgi:hypothetical protein
MSMVRIIRWATGYPGGIEDTRPLSEVGTSSLPQLREAYGLALASGDLRASRQVALAAAEDGLSLGRLYVDVVRPAIAGAACGWSADSARDRLLLGSVEAMLTVVAGRPAPGAAMRGQGRSALVSVGTAPLDVLDGQVIVDTLCTDGWSVDDVPAGTDAAAVAALARDRHVQLVVMPTSNPADLLLSAQTYTLLRRMADPPVIVACSLGLPDQAGRARAAGADACAGDPDELLELVSRRLPPAGVRNWGVRLRRLGTTLVIAPTGDLDPVSVEKLRQVVESRAGSFSAVVVDTREVASASQAGTDALLAWLRGTDPQGPPHRVLPGAPLQAALAPAVLDTAWLAAEADAGA